jgi:RimJ/RimL family protein N-acetyltransferase
MAAFPSRDGDSFQAHWAKILADPNVVARTVVLDGKVAGNLVCWEASGERLVGYWLGRSFWGQGIASRALAKFIASIATRPLHARVARHNLASIRVLEKAGFHCVGERRAAAPTGGEAVDEFLFTLIKDGAITRSSDFQRAGLVNDPQ